MTPAILDRVNAAAYIGIGTTNLDGYRKSDPSFPLPIWLDSHPRWARADLDEWVASLARSAAAPEKAPPVPVRHRRSKHDMRVAS